MAAAPSAETVPPTAGTVPDTAAPAAPAAPDAPVPAPGDVPRPPSRLGRRVPQLAAGLVLYGVSMGLMLRASLGGNPWDVLHQGLARHFGLSVGTWVTLVGACVLLLWVPLRQRPGVGTVGNVLVLGAAMDATLRLVEGPHALPARIALLAAGIVLNGLATGLYIGARLGPGPRDGLMTGLHRRTGRSLRLIRTGIELTVLTAGILLGGTFGVGTIAYALAIGPLAQFFLRWCTVPGGSAA